jgi:hypothetical protein
MGDCDLAGACCCRALFSLQLRDRSSNFMTDGVGPAVLWGGVVIFLLPPGDSQRPPGVTSCGDVRRPNHGNRLMVGFHGWSRGYCVLRLRRVLVQNRVNGEPVLSVRGEEPSRLLVP